jgi:hypothetical protein
MKLCKDCLHFSGANYCHAPENGINPVNGDSKTRFASTNRVHAPGLSDHCGPLGHFWVEKPIKSKPWYKFWS